MGFLRELAQRLAGRRRLDDVERQRFLDAWQAFGEARPEVTGFPEEPHALDAEHPGLDYERLQWQRKLKRLLGELPGATEECRALGAEAQRLGLGADWAAERCREEFEFMVRRAVADGTITEEEHRNLDLARELIGLEDREAVELLDKVCGEAESLFKRPIHGMERV